MLQKDLLTFHLFYVLILTIFLLSNTNFSNKLLSYVTVYPRPPTLFFFTVKTYWRSTTVVFTKAFVLIIYESKPENDRYLNKPD